MDGSAFNQLGRAIEATARVVAVLLIVFVPLGLWKLADIGWWLWTHIHIVWE